MAFTKIGKITTPLWSRITGNDKLLTENSDGILLEVGEYILNESSSLANSWSLISKVTTPTWSLVAPWAWENIDTNWESTDTNWEDMG